MRQRILAVIVAYARAIALGWATLLVAVFLIERPLLFLTARFLDPAWFATVRLALECGMLAGTGWVIGRLSRSGPLLAVLIFAATLTPWDFGAALEINIRWLLRLLIDTLRDPRYFESLLNTAMLHTFLFGSLIAGAMLTRRSPDDSSVDSLT
jgi:hypothetical protein